MSDMNLKAMKVAQLRQIANESGIDIPQKSKKNDIITLIEKKIEEVQAQIESGELKVIKPQVIVPEKAIEKPNNDDISDTEPDTSDIEKTKKDDTSDSTKKKAD